MQQEVTKYRPIIKDAGRHTQNEIDIDSMKGTHAVKADYAVNEVPIDYSLVPRLVNAQQFEAINFRRRVRFTIEKERIRAGRPVDGGRTETYKHFGRHAHAMNRVRQKGGAFVCTTNSVSSICDSLN